MNIINIIVYFMQYAIYTDRKINEFDIKNMDN